MRSINEIIIHCSATREGQDISVDTIKKWHVEGRGWSDICLLYTSPSPRDRQKSRMPSSA